MYLFFDVETTGLPINPKLTHTHGNNWPRIVSIAWILCGTNRKVVEIEKFIIRPNGWEIPKDATDIHGITTEQALSEGIDISTVLEKFMRAAKSASHVVGHNVRFDRKVVAAELYRISQENKYDEFLYEIPYRDTMHISRELVAILNKKKAGYKMPTLSEMYSKLYDKELEDAHDASADIKATLLCFWRLYDLGLVDRFYDTHKDTSEKTDYLRS